MNFSKSELSNRMRSLLSLAAFMVVWILFCWLADFVFQLGGNAWRMLFGLIAGIVSLKAGEVIGSIYNRRHKCSSVPMIDQQKDSAAASAVSIDVLEGVCVSVEYDHICIRNRMGWLLWSMKIRDSGRPELREIIQACEANQGAWLDGKPFRPSKCGMTKEDTNQQAVSNVPIRNQ